jgi:hypothetical protein
MLLGVSVLAVALVKTGLVPTKIEALGVEFDRTNQQSLLLIIALVTSYFLAAFVIYAAADFLSWRRALHRERGAQIVKQLEKIRDGLKEQDLEERKEIYARTKAWLTVFRLSNPVAIIRAIFEFVLPVVVGTYAIWLLLFSSARV